jgi:ribosomal protein S12 methylthiotransferase accessory factor
VSLLKSAPLTLRTGLPPATALDAYVGPFGLFRNPTLDLQSPFGSYAVEVPAKHATPYPALGRASSYQQSRTLAILEALERFCGQLNGGHRIHIRAAYCDVAAGALFPTKLGTHPPSCYAAKGFPHRAFDPDLVIDWVEAYCFSRNSALLVPERAAFWGPRDDGEASLFQTTSSGCAVGNSVEEAVLHGLLELIERDSFLMTWYLQLSLPELDIRAGNDPELDGLLRRCEKFTEMRFRAFLSTMEYKIPSVWLVAEGQRRDGPVIFAGAAAHLDLRQAVLRGVMELTKLVMGAAHYYPERRNAGLRMLENPALVHRLNHHALVNCLPEARQRFSFLLDREAKPIALRDLEASSSVAPVDLRQDLLFVISRLEQCGLDVLVVDQTAPELKLAGVTCIAALVPGLLPLTFGHVNRRTDNLPRLRHTAGLPYQSSLLAESDLGVHPHPFH